MFYTSSQGNCGINIQYGNECPARKIGATLVSATVPGLEDPQRWIAGLSDGALLQSFEQALAEDKTPLMWRIADEIERRRLSI